MAVAVTMMVVAVGHAPSRPGAALSLLVMWSV